MKIYNKEINTLVGIVILLLGLFFGYSQTGKRHSHDRGISPSAQEVSNLANSSPSTTDQMFQAATSLESAAIQQHDTKKLQQAIELYKRTITVNPYHKEALLKLATLSFNMGVYNSAVAYFQMYLSVAPTDSAAQLNLALCLIKLGKTDEALNELQKLLVSEPRNFQAQLAVAVAYKHKQSFQEALSAALRAAEYANENNENEVAQRLIADIKALSSSKQQTSPALTIADLLRSHPVIKPHIKAISWPTSSTAKIELSNDELCSLSPGAVADFEKQLQTSLAQLEESITLEFFNHDKLCFSTKVGQAGS